MANGRQSRLRKINSVRHKADPNAKPKKNGRRSVRVDGPGIGHRVATNVGDAGNKK
jgi:hypothetical protein